jgi:hypothetical protein
MKTLRLIGLVLAAVGATLLMPLCGPCEDCWERVEDAMSDWRK